MFNKNAAPLESPEVDPSEAALAISMMPPQQDLDVSGSKSQVLDWFTCETAL